MTPRGARLVVAGTVLTGLAAWAVAALALAGAPMPDADVAVGSGRVRAAVAATHDRRSWGLQGRTSLGESHGMLFVYDIGVISGAILFIKDDFSLSPGLEEIVISSVLLGSLLGAVIGGLLADRLGRRRLLVVTAVVFGSGAIWAALAPGTPWLVGARFVAGLAIGTASFVAPLYIS